MVGLVIVSLSCGDKTLQLHLGSLEPSRGFFLRVTLNTGRLKRQEFWQLVELRDVLKCVCC